MLFNYTLVQEHGLFFSFIYIFFKFECFNLCGISEIIRAEPYLINPKKAKSNKIQPNNQPKLGINQEVLTEDGLGLRYIIAQHRQI